MEVKPPAAAARDPALNGLRVLEAGFAQVHMHVDEARRHYHSGGVESLRACGEERPGATPAMRPSYNQHVGYV